MLLVFLLHCHMKFIYRISFFVNKNLERHYSKKYLFSLIEKLNLVFTDCKLHFELKNILYDKFMQNINANRKNCINLLHKLTKKYKNFSTNNENIIFFIGTRKLKSRVRGLVVIGNAYNRNNNFGLLFHSNNFFHTLIHEILHSLNLSHSKNTIMNKYGENNHILLNNRLKKHIYEFLNDNYTYFT